MEDPFAWLGLAVYRLRYAVVPFWLVIALILGGLFAARATDVLKGGGFYTPDSGSQNADNALATYFHAGSLSTALVAFQSTSGTVDDASFRAQVTSAESRLKTVDKVRSVTSFYDTHDPSAVSSDRRTTFLTVSINGDESTSANTVPLLRQQLKTVTLKHWVTGGPAFAHDGATAAQTDVENAEKLTFPVAIILLLLAFGTVVSSIVPLFLGAFTVVITISLVTAVGTKLDSSIFGLNIGSMLGLGLAIDYSLIVVTRFREEYALWKDTKRALGITMATAGRSITYSGLTVMLAMLVMTVALWPMMLIRTISLAVLICAACGLVLALTLLPAILSMLGHRTEWLRVLPKPKARKVGQTGFWYTFSELVMRRPVLWLVGALVILGLLAAPALQLTTAGPSAPATTEATKGINALKVAFSGNKLSPVQVIIEAPREGIWKPEFLAGTRQLTSDLKADPRVSDVNSLASAMSTLPPTRFDALTPATLGPAAPVAAVYVNTNGDNSVMTLNVISRYDSRDSRTEGLVRDIREKILPNQTAFKSDTVYVGGEAATFYDYKVALYRRFPYALVAVMVMIFLILMMFFQSLFLPVKAIVLNLLSVAATFGVLVLVFQHGFASQLLRFDSLGYITVITPVMLYVILFSLSTDYEVFLLSRVKEYYYSHGDNREAVAVGLQHTAGLITAAALILLGTFGSFSFGDSLVVKELGVGLGVGVLVDSTLVRVVLVPATMALAGRANWWLPSSVKRFLPALGEGTSIALAGQAEAAPAPAMAAAATAGPESKPTVTGPALLRLRSRVLPVIDQIRLVPGQPYRFGRDDGNEIQIAVPTISRVHARIDHLGGIWRLRDLGSTNGTWVDGHQVPPGAEGVALHNGDWIMLGGLDDLIVIFDSTSLAPAAGREPAGTGAVS